jgi:DNA polymerase IV
VTGKENVADPHRQIVHVDMDAFYASVEERDNPRLVGRPVVVGGAPERRGVVAAANYAARRFGVHSAMPTSTAKRLCPHIVLLTPRMQRYAEASAAIHEIFHRYTPLVEPLALDEAFLDLTGSEKLFGPAQALARGLKSEIRAELGLVASVGVAPNKFLAKLASEREKPDGLVVVEPGSELAFLDPLPVSALWGVGRVSGAAFRDLGLRNIADVRLRSAHWMKRHFGALGERLWMLAHGRDSRAVVPDRDAKSISHETTFPKDVRDPRVLRAVMGELSGQVARRLRRLEVEAGAVRIKVRYFDFKTVTRSRQLPEPTDNTPALAGAAIELLGAALAQRSPAVRLVGMGAADLQRRGPRQQRLFDEAARVRQSEIDALVDEVSERYGSAALRRGMRRDS